MRSLDVAQPDATVRKTVRNRSREGPMAVPMASSAKVVTLGGFGRSSLVSRGRRGTCDIPTCFITCQKSFCVAGQYFCAVFRR